MANNTNKHLILNNEKRPKFFQFEIGHPYCGGLMVKFGSQ